MITELTQHLTDLTLIGHGTTGGVGHAVQHVATDVPSTGSAPGHGADVALSAHSASAGGAGGATQHILAEGEQINVNPIAPPGQSKFVRILGWMRWVLTAVGIAGVMAAGGYFAWERWGHGQTHAPKMLAGAIVGSVIIAVAPQLIYAASS